MTQTTLELQTLAKMRVMQAFLDGKTIQYRRLHPKNEWSTATSPQWGWDAYDYRVKFEPREWWVLDPAPCTKFSRRELAESFIAHNPGICGTDIVHVREVPDE